MTGWRGLFVVPAGLESVVKRELPGATRLATGLLSRDYSARESLCADAYRLRSVYRALLYVGEGPAATLDEVRQTLETVPWRQWLDRPVSFACRCQRRGDHPYRSPDVERLAGAVVLAQVPFLKVNLTNPDVIIRIIIVQERLYVGFDLIGLDALHKRRYRRYHHPAALNPVLAYLLTTIADVHEQTCLLDPFCGGGTILIEACHRVRRMPAGYFRKNELAFQRLPVLADLPFDELFDQWDAMITANRPACLMGWDYSSRHLAGARQNAQAALCADAIQLQQQDLRRVARIPDEINCLITNPPYGVRMGHPRRVEQLHRHLARLAVPVVQRGGQLVVITPHVEWLAAELGSPAQLFHTYNGDLPVAVGVWS